MRLTSVPVSLVAVFAASLGQAQYLINELSFGYAGRLARPESPGQIQHFTLSGQPNAPEVLSNKLVLTPISPGNQRSSIWANTPLTHSTWEADVDFRANGPERGGGNLNIWLKRRADTDASANSIYTAGKFDGLALVVDGHGDRAGMIRGFLNDGTVDYSTHHSVDSLAFGHCQYSYRNLGRPSQIKLRQSGQMFKVEIDGQPCFETAKVRLPAGYYFGITAVTPDTPDSFEVFKLAVMSVPSQDDNKNTNIGGGDNKDKLDYTSRQNAPSHGGSDNAQGGDFDDNMPDQDPDVFSSSKAQFSDLHNRLQSLNHQLSAVFRSVGRHHQMDEQRHDEIKGILHGLQSALSKLDQVNEMQRKLTDLEREVKGMRGDLTRRMQDNDRTFKSYLSDHHATLSQAMVETVPGHGRLIVVVVGMQVVLAVAYILYKRRKATMPKKYL